ncbi:MAG: hypothetical protein HFJ16_00670 [Romboutsia sp.]|uniref:Eco57I restriction-modification methylase domain-containing protein n=1 Tax=Romboutsia sp. TaxID=1965302 RepID=UPI00216C398C|nr:Eco57I restriction-modification methylase domain-containing protein [Romboutsia sp.]MCI9258738.1 hypothetical protein [Romboutsia sp.]
MTDYKQCLEEYEKYINSNKLKEDLNKMGQFFTPLEFADEITNLSLSYFDNDKPIKFLEPALGTGSFYYSLNNNIDQFKLDYAVGIEKDEEIYSFSTKTWHDKNIRIVNKSFFDISNSINNKFNLLLSNPPYTRHQNIGKQEKIKLREMVKEQLGLDTSGYCGLYVYFILLSHRMLEEDAIATWLIPSEFMSTNYGKVLKQYLLEYVELKHIHIFDTNKSKFKNALVSSTIIIYKKKKVDNSNKIKITIGEKVFNPDRCIEVDRVNLNNEDKWNNIFIENKIKSKDTNYKIGDFFDIKRGIATGNNELFILTESKALKLGISKEFYSYILPSSKKLKDTVINADKEGRPIIEEPLVLINTDLEMEELKLKSRNLYEYLKKAEEEGKSEGYLLKKRKIWYKQEQREVTPFVCTYMGRNTIKNNNKPFNIYLNLSQAIVSNNYLMIYPKGKLSEIIEKDSSTVKDIYEILKNIDQEHYFNQGREYGGGLKKIEPKELYNLPIEGLAEYISEFYKSNK